MHYQAAGASATPSLLLCPRKSIGACVAAFTFAWTHRSMVWTARR